MSFRVSFVTFNVLPVYHTALRLGAVNFQLPNFLLVQEAQLMHSFSEKGQSKASLFLARPQQKGFAEELEQEQDC